ncbi:hypothetical protein HMPREF9999_01312 [Alloprevotella sp. oral taxon 473 str. F0040]|nr:hypothetical protein HMPREF9999_01312 [Alloprevotella sp. oral taxon 473 str. F0040]
MAHPSFYLANGEVSRPTSSSQYRVQDPGKVKFTLLFLLKEEFMSISF